MERASGEETDVRMMCWRVGGEEDVTMVQYVAIYAVESKANLSRLMFYPSSKTPVDLKRVSDLLTGKVGRPRKSIGIRARGRSPAISGPEKGRSQGGGNGEGR